MSITHNENPNPLFDLLMKLIPARSVPKILCTKDEYTFLLSNFLIIVLCNSPSKSLLYIISFLTVPLEKCFIKSQQLKQVNVGIHHI